MIRLNDILDELYSNPICPRKKGESDEAYKLRCAPLMGPSVLMNIPSVSEEKNEVIEEENEPTDSEKWSYAKAQAKKKFDIYPSAYANAWASKKYKELGGKWKKKD